METVLITLASVGIITALILVAERRHQRLKRPPGRLFQKDTVDD